MGIPMFNITRALHVVYPNEQGSYSSLYGRALNDGVISQEEYNSAKLFYRNLWNYCGD